MPFRFLEDIAIADVAFEATGKTLEEVFEAAGTATTEVMVDRKQVELKVKRSIELDEKDAERLLYSFLENLIFIKDVEGLLFGKMQLTIHKNQTYHLSAELVGDRIDSSKQELRNDVKAVTYHMFELKQNKDGWITRVVLDI